MSDMAKDHRGAYDVIAPSTMDAAYRFFSGEDATSGAHDPVYLAFRAGWIAHARKLDRILRDSPDATAEGIREHLRNAV